MAGRRKPRGLRPEERELWQKIAKTADPLHPHKPADPAASRLSDPPAPAASPPAAPPWSPPPFSIGQKRSGTAAPNDLQAPLRERLAAQPVKMDAKRFTRMKRGKMPIEARIDLHGMTLDQAYPRLNSFIMGAHAQGLRLVLVITGKGRRASEDGPIPVRHGILKHQVPQWLQGGMMGVAVLQIAPAHQSHGGSGAFYVYLRRGR
ncbi:Smr/MutS family protein [Profundibacterium mesophilum]|uniref:Smr proteinMutS2 n=1 Tax=Profundibacterium mesophilum KAUST100406-0324 TaxID=1037889 RepID=A0A921NVC7_9RHOB|nr:Smr/MutS family protein [Profundibacterium mesophilum]KAF0676308.1 putative Smr proteinMutS2 [Profundibacterium mesophilum KAUST100406-0324]